MRQPDGGPVVDVFVGCPFDRNTEFAERLERAEGRLTGVGGMFATEENSRGDYLATRQVAEKRPGSRRLKDLAGQDSLESLIGQRGVLLG